MEESTDRRLGMKLSKLRHCWWWIFTISVILLGIALWLEHPLFERMVWFALAIFTLVYAYSTSRLAEEAKKEQRLDSSRPSLVPVGGKEGVARLVEPYRRMNNATGQWLHVRNIGLGPAVNIAIRLEWRSGDLPRLDLDEMLTAVEPLAANGKGLVRQWKNVERPIEIYDEHWIVISYDDSFGRHFETEGRRIKESDSWVNIKTVQVEKPPARVREVDYYKSISQIYQSKGGLTKVRIFPLLREEW